MLIFGALLWPVLAVYVKRCHDRDKSGWWLLLLAIPCLGVLWWLIDLGLLEGTPGPNSYGVSPLRGSPIEGESRPLLQIVATPCRIAGCGRESETECDACVKDVCSFHGSYYGGGGELHFLCDPCFERNQASSNPGRFVNYGSRANADRMFSEDH
jgi:hypothetical protein